MSAEKQQLYAQIEQRLGVMPNSLRFPADNPEITQKLWDFAVSAYLDNPLPSIFKERLFVYISSFSTERYPVSRHLGFLIGMGHVAGDASASPQPIQQVVKLLEKRLPHREDLQAVIRKLLAISSPVIKLPEPDSGLEEAIFACATHVFLRTADSPGCLEALKHVLNGSDFQYLMLFLAFIRSAHFWTEVQTDLSLENDIQQLLDTHSTLAALLTDEDAQDVDSNRTLLNEVDMLRLEKKESNRLWQRELSLREKQEAAIAAATEQLKELERANQQINQARRAALNLMEDAIQSREALRLNQERMGRQAEAFRAAINGAPLHESLNIISSVVVEETQGAARIAFYLANFEGKNLHPVFGAATMPEDYLKEIDGFLIGEHSLACGLAVAANKPVITPDVLEEPLWEPWTHIAKKYNYRGCWSFPIKRKDKEALGTFAVYFESPRDACPEDIKLAEIVTQTAAVIMASHIEAIKRSQAEQALRESEERLQLSIKGANLFTWEVDPETGETKYSDNFAEVVGYDMSNISKENFKNIHPDDKDFVLQSVDKALKNEAPLDVEHRIINPETKKNIWVRAQGRLVKRSQDKKPVFMGITQNITTRKLAEEALRESEEQFRRAIENAPIPVIMYTENGEVLQLSKTFSELTGLKVENIPTFDKWMKYILGNDAPPLEQHLTELFWSTHNHRLNVEFSIMTISGSLRYWSFSVSSPGMLRDGRRFMVGMAVDITERRKAEEEVRESEQRLRTLSDAVPQIIWTNDAEGKAVYFNQRWYDYSGLSFEQAAGPGWQAIVHPDDAQSSNDKWQKSLSTAETFDTEYRLRRHDGSYRWFIARNVPLRDKNGKVISWFGSATDIDELKRMQEALGQSEAKLKITLESAVDYAIITMDTKRIVQKWSSGAEKCFGYKEAEMIGKPADIIFTDEDRAANVPEKEMETARLGGKANDERWHQHKDGSRSFMSGVMRPIYDGVLTGYVKIARDMTAQKLIEQQKDDFIGIASHELKTPVTSIKAYAELLRETIEEKQNDETGPLVIKLDEQIDRLIELIHSLLDTTKIAEGQLFISMESFDLNKLIKEKVDEIQRSTSNHSIKLVGDQSIIVYADRKRIEEVLNNLLSNAIKYSPNGGEIIVTTERKQEGSIQISIKDKGIGIPENAKAKLFNRFYRVKNAQVDTYPGMGLGLYIAHAIIKQHHGDMWVTSKLNDGSTFYFTLPSH